MLILINNKINSQIHLVNNRLYRGESVRKSAHFQYTINGIPFGFKKQKPSKLIVSRVFTWAQMDSNHRPSDYEADGFIRFSPVILIFLGFRYTLGTTPTGGCSNVFNQRK